MKCCKYIKVSNSLTKMDSAKEIINRLESYANYGQIRCSINIRHCYLSNLDYGSDIDMFERSLVGAFKYYPYNSYYYHIENDWMFPCLQSLHLTNKQIIPHSYRHRYHTLPNIVKIKRSNGEVHDTMVVNNQWGIRLRKSESHLDNYEHFYVRVHWDDNNKQLNEELVRDLAMNNMCSYKDVTLEHLVEQNPEIRNTGIQFNFYPLAMSDNISDIQREVIRYCNQRMSEMIEGPVKDAIERYKNIVQIRTKIIFE